MPKYTRSNIDNLWKVDDGSGVEKWTIDARVLPKPEELRAGPVKRNTENKGLKKVKEGIAGKVEAKYEVNSDVTDQEGKPVSFGTREHELREAARVSKAPATSTGWDSSTYDPEVDGYASEYGYDPADDVSWENKRSKKVGQQTQYGWKALLKEARPGGKSVFSRWIATKTLGAEKGVSQTPTYWTGDTPEHGEDLVPGPHFTDADFRATHSQGVDLQGKPIPMGPERAFKQLASAEEETLAKLSVTGDPNKKGQRLKTVNIPERADYESQQAGTQTDNDAADKAVAQVFAPTPKAQKTTRATPTPTAQPAPAVDPQTGTTNTPMKIVCPTCSAVSGDDPVAFHMEHQRLHAQ